MRAQKCYLEIHHVPNSSLPTKTHQCTIHIALKLQSASKIRPHSVQYYSHFRPIQRIRNESEHEDGYKNERNKGSLSRKLTLKATICFIYSITEHWGLLSAILGARFTNAMTLWKVLYGLCFL